MTTEEKAKAYDKALKQARKELNTCGSFDCDAARQIFRFFPQLAESEDERIRKALIEALTASKFIGELKFRLPEPTPEECIAWLEKQKEYKSLPIDLSIEDVETIKTALRESGLEFISNQKVYDKLEKIPDSAYYLSTIGRSKLYPDGTVVRHTIGYLEKQKVENVSATTMIPSCWEVEQKPAEWSEEDERILKGIIGFIDHNQHYGVSNKDMLNWLKSIRPSWKPTEEQMEALHCAIEDVAKFSKRGGRQVELENEPYYKALRSLYEQLKKLM